MFYLKVSTFFNKIGNYFYMKHVERIKTRHAVNKKR